MAAGQTWTEDAAITKRALNPKLAVVILSFGVQTPEKTHDSL